MSKTNSINRNTCSLSQFCFWLSATLTEDELKFLRKHYDIYALYGPRPHNDDDVMHVVFIAAISSLEHLASAEKPWNGDPLVERWIELFPEDEPLYVTKNNLWLIGAYFESRGM